MSGLRSGGARNETPRPVGAGVLVSSSKTELVLVALGFAVRLALSGVRLSVLARLRAHSFAVTLGRGADDRPLAFPARSRTSERGDLVTLTLALSLFVAGTVLR